MKEKGLLLVISGFSGAGKGTVVKRLLELHNDYALSISATTRSPREGEQNGREYFFKSTEEFESMIDNSELIEYASMSATIMEHLRHMSRNSLKQVRM